jgi:hypothetical protein
MYFPPPLDLREPPEPYTRTGTHHDILRQEAGQTEWVIIRGKRVSLAVTGFRESQSVTAPRGVIRTFSQRARRRMLVKVAEIDWRAAGSVLFVTVTYPPQHEDHTPAERSKHRAVFNRHVERHLGGPVGSVWRVEWKERLSGITKGHMAPHIHNLYFGVRFMSKRWVAEKWAQSIGCNTPVVVDVQRCDSYKKVQVYIAKYCAKEPDLLLLDNVPYRNRTGRHAGWLRKKEIPMLPGRVFKVRTAAVTDFLKQRASETMRHYDERYGAGFTVIGDVAVELAEDLAKFILDGGLEQVYAY